MKILFVCKANVFRSQIAESLFNKLMPEIETKSAGTAVSANSEGKRLRERKNRESDLMLEMMKSEEGIDLGEKESKPLTPKLVDWADKIICMAQKDTLPEFLLQSGKVEYWAIEDASAGSDYEFFVEAKDRIKNKVEKLKEKVVNENTLA